MLESFSLCAIRLSGHMHRAGLAAQGKRGLLLPRGITLFHVAALRPAIPFYREALADTWLCPGARWGKVDMDGSMGRMILTAVETGLEALGWGEGR